jgi:hypothetical protein
MGEHINLSMFNWALDEYRATHFEELISINVLKKNTSKQTQILNLHGKPEKIPDSGEGYHPLSY